MRLVFVHGWGFDSRIWAELARNFADHSFSERGYFGAPTEANPGGDFIAVTHSFGTMRLLAGLQPDCCGIVAINSFDRFTASKDYPGVPARMVDRMIARFVDAPREELGEFRGRCGCDTPFGKMDETKLLEDLVALRDSDCRSQAAHCDLPILSLQGAYDAILPAAMRDAVFAGASRCEHRTHETGGHLLPLQHPATCADAISAFMERLR
ncbi:MAG: alpha/beta hydrolase [Novosphingobium sp.]|nr:alpha/beta hydrolase [Novosphingobium sp.]